MLRQSPSEMDSRGCQDEHEHEVSMKNNPLGGSFEGADECDDPLLVVSDEQLENGMSLPPLETWNVEDLQKVSKDPEILDAMIMASPLVVALENKKSQLLSENTKLAKENLTCEETIASLMEELSVKQEMLRNLLDEVEKSSASYAKLAEAYSPNNIRESLQKSVLAIDEDSERIAEHFLQGGVDIDEFIADYTGKRKLSHIRKIKCEKLGNQLKKFEQAGL